MADTVTPCPDCAPLVGRLLIDLARLTGASAAATAQRAGVTQ